VLGTKKPSPALARRVYRALELPFLDTPILFSGAGGEAEAAAELARQHAPHRRVLQECRATSTRENAAFSAEMLAGVRRVVVVSDEAHLFRCYLVFRRFFEEVAVVSCGPGRWGRESLVLGWYALRGWL
jgi:uncharacterized SAM-binding protein YcdF (DUF218 family)